MKNLSISTRLSLSVALFVIPLALLLYFYVGEITKQIDFAVQEKQGNTYLRPLVKILAGLNGHQDATLQASLDEKKGAAARAAAADVVEQGLKELDAAQASLGVSLQFTESGLKSRNRGQYTIEALKDKWRAITSAPSADTAIYQAAIADVKAMIAHAGDMSNLILDPDLDSYYTMDATLLALPQLLGRVGQINATMIPVLQARDFSDANKAQAGTFSAMINESDTGRALADMDTAFNEDANFYGASATLKANVQPKLDAYKVASDAYAASLQVMAGSNAGSASSDDLLKKSGALIDSTYRLWVAAVDELDILLDKRIESFTSARNATLLEASAAITLAFAFFWDVKRSIRHPLMRLQAAMLKIADGEMGTQVPCLDLKDELGDMARTLEIFKETSIEAEKMSEEKKWEDQARLARQAKVDEQIRRFQSTVGGLLREVSDAADVMNKMAGSLIRSTDSSCEKASAAASLTQEVTMNVSTVAAAAEELSSAINEISAQVARSTGVTGEAVSRTQEADAAVHALVSVSQRIGEIISLIENIAGQINLLALNATIESARAGEAGKGFAVVAAEVKNLATQTGKATEEITAQITEVQKVADGVVRALTHIDDSIKQVNNITTTIAAAVEEQGAVTQEIAMNINKTSNQVRQVSGNVGEVNQIANNTTADAREVLTAVQDFSARSQSLQSEVSSFLEQITKAA